MFLFPIPFNNFAAESEPHPLSLQVRWEAFWDEHLDPQGWRRQLEISVVRPDVHPHYADPLRPDLGTFSGADPDAALHGW